MVSKITEISTDDGEITLGDIARYLLSTPEFKVVLSIPDEKLRIDAAIKTIAEAINQLSEGLKEHNHKTEDVIGIDNYITKVEVRDVVIKALQDLEDRIGADALQEQIDELRDIPAQMAEKLTIQLAREVSTINDKIRALQSLKPQEKQIEKNTIVERVVDNDRLDKLEGEQKQIISVMEAIVDNAEEKLKDTQERLLMEMEARIKKDGNKVAIYGGAASRNKLKLLLDVKVDGITDGQGIAYDAATDTYVPVDIDNTENIEDIVGAMFVDSSTIDFTYDDGANTITADVIAGGVDHGSLSGLTDDDHTQYILVDGSRAFTSPPSSPDGQTDSEVWGAGATASQVDNTVLGTRASATSNANVVIGTDASATLNLGVAIGFESECAGFSTAVGYQSEAATIGTAIGYQSQATAANAFALGAIAVASNASSLCVGTIGNVSGSNSIGIGTSNVVAGDNAVGIGGSVNIDAAADNSIGIGLGANIDGAGSIGIGTSVSVTGDNTCVIGSTSYAIDEIYIGGGQFGITAGELLISTTGGTGTNIAGSDIVIGGGRGTGNATGGTVAISTAPAGASGSSLNALVERVNFDDATGVEFNASGEDYDFIVNGDTAELINADAGNDFLTLGAVGGIELGDNTLRATTPQTDGMMDLGSDTKLFNDIKFSGTANATGAGGIRLKKSTDNVSDPPTDAELDSAFGTPANNVDQMFLLDDNDADTDVWLVTSNGTSWYYTQLTKAT